MNKSRPPAKHHHFEILEYGKKPTIQQGSRKGGERNFIQSFKNHNYRDLFDSNTEMRGQWKYVFKILKGNYLQPRILYAEK